MGFLFGILLNVNMDLWGEKKPILFVMEALLIEDD